MRVETRPAMKRYVMSILLMLVFQIVKGENLFSTDSVMSVSSRVADYFITHNPDVGAKSYVGGKERNSKIWTRGVFYEGLLNLYRENPEERWLRYSIDWGEFHKWVSSSDNEAKAQNADYQCCGQAYLQMYMMDPTRTERMSHIKMRIDQMIATGRINWWTWIDAIQMAMPVMAMLGSITGDEVYWDKMGEMYRYTRDSQGGSGKGGGDPLFNTATGLWYRDYQFDPPYRDLTEPDKDCYWSRGNGWVYMALARVMQFTPDTEPGRALYEEDFKAMSRGLLDCQREDGFWNVSLAAPTNFGSAGSEGPEMSGTSLFVGGMAWGVATGMLDADTYLPAIEKGWKAMHAGIHPDGYVGYMQGSGSKPEDGGPITYDSHPDFEDFGFGCWLWGAAEVHSLLASLESANPDEDPEDEDPEEPNAVKAIETDYPDHNYNIADTNYYDLFGRIVRTPVRGNFYVHRRRLIRY